jgi:TPP-dependent pyruvate/acetoin dehydrogenase alpha subunit
MVVTRKLTGIRYLPRKLTNRMSDPGTTYRSRDEVQQVRSERDAIAGLKKYILEWGATDEASLKVSPLFIYTTQC